MKRSRDSSLKTVVGFLKSEDKDTRKGTDVTNLKEASVRFINQRPENTTIKTLTASCNVYGLAKKL